MINKEEKPNLKEAITTGPTVSGLVAPSKENRIKPLNDVGDEYSYERCTHCGFCRHVCRVYNNSWSETDYAGGRNKILKALDRKDIKFDKEDIIPSLFRCMLCGNCEVVCPVGVKTREVFQNFRKEAITKGTMPAKLGMIRKTVRENNNPFLEKDENRFDWTESTEAGKAAYERSKRFSATLYKDDGTPKISKFPKGKSPEVGYFVGCTASYKNKELSYATSEVLGKLGVEFVLFPDEMCCGSVLFRTGLEVDTPRVITNNYETVRKTGVKDVVFSCSGCFSTWTLEYERLIGKNLGFNLYHLTQYALKKIKEKNLRIKYPHRSKEDPMIITYHDPCHLGRYCGVYEEPRELLRMIEGIQLLEMRHNREMSWCCGAGGGVKALYGDLADMVGKDRLDETLLCVVRLSEDRLKEAVETKAETLISSCVFCKNNFSGVAKNFDTPIKVMDISQLLLECEFY